MTFKLFRRRMRFWLQKKGIQFRRVKYRVEVPQMPLPVQKALLERMGINRPLIFDIGANLGNVTARYRQMFPEAEIYAFEPFPELVERLEKRFAQDKLVHIVPLAVSDKARTAVFHLTGSHTTNSLLPREEADRRYYPERGAATGKTIEVATTTLDAFCAEKRLDRVDILKMDIQGGEMLALRGAAESLRNRSIKIIFTESALIQHYEGESLLYEITELLAGFGFSLYDLYHLYRGRNGQLRYCEAIFVSSQLRAEALDTFEDEP
jgi:FkbM family methyltransferase